MLHSQAEIIIKQYEAEFKSQISKRTREKRISNDRKFVITGIFLFNKKPNSGNNLFRNGFKEAVVHSVLLHPKL